MLIETTESDSKRALELDPNSFKGHYHVCNHDLLVYNVFKIQFLSNLFS